MKKLKIMLLSLLVFAVVGGALAFKTKAMLGPQQYCTTNAVQDAQGNFSCPATPASCPLLVNVTTTTQAGIIPMCTTTKPPLGCVGVQNCTNLSRIIGD